MVTTLPAEFVDVTTTTVLTTVGIVCEGPLPADVCTTAPVPVGAKLAIAAVKPEMAEEYSDGIALLNQAGGVGSSRAE